MSHKYRIVKNEHNGQVGYDPQILSYGAGYQITEIWESLLDTKFMGGMAVSTYVGLLCKTLEEADSIIKGDIEQKKKWEYKQEVVAEYDTDSFIQKQQDISQLPRVENTQVKPSNPPMVKEMGW